MYVHVFSGVGPVTSEVVHIPSWIGIWDVGLERKL